MADIPKKLSQALTLMEVALTLIDETGTAETVGCNLDLAIQRLHELIAASAQSQTSF
jgi:hypothetical protein